MARQREASKRDEIDDGERREEGDQMMMMPGDSCIHKKLVKCPPTIFRERGRYRYTQWRERESASEYT